MDELFDIEPTWKEAWEGMPEFHQDDLMPWDTVKVHFRNQQDRLDFQKAIGQKIGERNYCWYPEAERNVFTDKEYRAVNPKNPKYPVYIISKGRWESRLTAKALDKIGVPYSIVVEPQEYDNYAAVIDEKKILTLPFSNLGQGSIPARNWVWDHAASIGAERHWILDDNISGFIRRHKNLKIPIGDGTIFRAAEDFTDRYENVAMSGFNYRFLGGDTRSGRLSPFIENTRIYSCILLKNDIPFRWRGRYNEDTDLSIRILKSGLCTILFNTFLANKQSTMTMKGGNTDELYADNGRQLMAESLQQQHPDIVTVTRKFNRVQHHVDYRAFKQNKLIPKPGLNIDRHSDAYSMILYENIHEDNPVGEVAK